MVRIGNKKLVLVFFLVALMVVGISPALRAEDKLVYRVPIRGTIDHGMVNLVSNGIDMAEMNQADKIVFEIDTYGGLVDPAIKIRDQIFASSVPTVTYIPGRAWSAGALIALAGEELIMAPGSTIGAAETRPQEEKYISALRTEFKATAERRGKNPQIAEAMVDKNVEIDGIVSSGQLLTLTVGESLEHEIAEGEESDFRSLLTRYNLEGAEVREVKLTPAEKMASWVVSPGISVLLLTLGFVALAFEAIAPGWGIGGTVGLLSLGLFFSGYIIYGVASWGLAILFAVGVVLLLMEAFVVPGFGVTGIGGIIAVVSSLYFVFPDPRFALGVLTASFVFSIFGIALLIKVFGGSRFWKRITLEESQTKEGGYVSHQDDTSDLLGKEGVTKGVLRPAGIAEIEGERIDVISEGGFVDAGELVKVVKVTGSKVIVKRIKEES